MEKTKVGIIGCGNISDLYFHNLTHRFGDDIEVISCSDIYLKKAEMQAKKYGVSRVYSVEDMLNDSDVEIVINITVPQAHTEINRAAIKAGKHVFCEKPLALTFEEAKETVRLAEEHHVQIACAPDTFLGAGIQTCRQLLDEGWIGHVTAGTANFVWPGHEIWHPSPAFYYKKGAGPMFDMGPYYIAALVAMLGPVKKLTAMVSRARDMRTITSKPFFGQKIDVEVPTHYSGLLEFCNGTIITVNMSFDVWISSLPHIELYGSEGSMFCPNPDLFTGPVKVLRGENVVDSLVDLDLSSAGTKGNPFDFSGYLKEMPLLYHDPLVKIRGLGVVELAHSVKLGRPCRISHDFILHVMEILTAFECASQENAVYYMTSTCERPAGMPMNKEMNKLD